MDKNLIARASININVPREEVWAALVTPEAIKQYMFNTNVVSDWHEGSPIVWKGECMRGDIVAPVAQRCCKFRSVFFEPFNQGQLRR